MSTLNGMKYVVFSDNDHERIILFPAIIEHRSFATSMPKSWRPVRAGFVFFALHDADGNTLEGRFKCYGESISLNLESDPEKDLMLLNRELVKE